MDVEEISARRCSKASWDVRITPRHRGERLLNVCLLQISKLPVSHPSNQPESNRLFWQLWKTLAWTTVTLLRRSGSLWLASLTGSYPWYSFLQVCFAMCHYCPTNICQVYAVPLHFPLLDQRNRMALLCKCLPADAWESWRIFEIDWRRKTFMYLKVVMLFAG